MRIRIPTSTIKSAMVTKCLQLTVAALLSVLCLFSSGVKRMNAQASAETRTDARCISNLKRIYHMVGLYVHYSGGTRFPTSLDKIDLMTHDKTVFVCPADVTASKPLKKHSFRTSYEIVNDPRKPEFSSIPHNKIAIVAEVKPNHNGKRFVLFYDGSVRAFDETQFDKLKNDSFVLDRNQ
jgi:hypothetical protein